MNQEVYLLESLHAALSEDQDQRKAGEDALKILDATENYGVMLTCNILNNRQLVPSDIRQFAAILLKQYVDAHWNPACDKFIEPEVAPKAKKKIMETLPCLLCDDNSKIRSAVAHAISGIATWEWPENWPTLFPIIVEGVKSGNEFSLDGAIRVLNEISSEVSVDQIFQMIPVVVPEILAILRNFAPVQVSHTVIIVKTIKVYQTLITISADCHDLKEAHRVVAANINDVLNECQKMLMIPLAQNDIQEPKLSSISLVQTLCKYYPKLILPALQNGLMTTILQVYEAVAGQYCQLAVNSNDLNEATLEDESVGLLDLAKEMLILLSTIYGNGKICQVLSGNLPDTLFCTLLLSQASEESLSIWQSDPGVFIEEDDLDYGDVSSRNDAAAFIVEVLSEPKKSNPLTPASLLSRALTMSEKMYSENDVNWWKLREAAFFVLSKMNDLPKEVFDTDVLKQLWESFFLDSRDKPSFLIASEISTASNFFAQMPHELLVKFLPTVSSGLDSQHPNLVRVQSLKAVQNLDVFIDNPKEEVLDVVHDLFVNLVMKAVQIGLDLEKEDTQHFVLDLLLQTLITLTDLCQKEELVLKVEPKIGPFALALWIKYNNEMVITELCKTLLGNLAKFEQSCEIISKRVVPTAVSILKSSSNNSSNQRSVNVGASAVALELLTEIVKKCRSRDSPVVGEMFCNCMQFTLESDDTAVVQSGCDLLKSYVSSFGKWITLWQDKQGRNALYYIVNIVLKILSPETEEMGAVFVGRLMAVVLVHLADEIGSHLDQILKAVLSKMQQTKTLSVFMSLITIYAILINHKLSEVVTFLSSLPDPTGRSALEYVLKEWVANQHNFYGMFERQVTCIALSKLLQHVLNPDSLSLPPHNSILKTMMVQGDLILNTSEKRIGPMTRSKAKDADQYTSIPLPIKILKLLLQEYQSYANETEDDAIVMNNELDETSDADSSSDGEMNFGGRNYVTVDEFFTGQSDKIFADELNEEMDDDLKNDPFVSLDLKMYLTEYFGEIKKLCFYHEFACALNAEESKLMEKF